MIELRLLGSLEITDGLGLPAASVLAQPKRAALLAYLVIATPHGFHRRDTLLALFWPEADAARARHALNQAIHHLRLGLGHDVIVTRGTEEVAVDAARVRCDVSDMREALASRRLDDALGLYRADLLSGFRIDASVEFDEWLERERRALHEAAVAAATALATGREAEGDVSAALMWARRASALAPTDEACARRLIGLLMRGGNDAAAHAEFDRLAARLKRDFDVEPSAQTAALLNGKRSNAHGGDVPTSPSPLAVEAPADVRTPARPLLWPMAAAAVVLLGVGGSSWLMRSPVTGSAQSVAIAPFSVPTGDTALVRLGQSLVTTIGANMDHVGEIRVADGIAMLSAAKSKGYLFSAADALALARQLGASSVVHGTLVAEGRSVRADAVLYDVRNRGDQIAHVTATVPIENLGALTDSLSWALLRGIWSRGRAPTPSVEGITTRNPASMRAFLEGERQLAHGSVREAADAYKRAVEADTTFALAHYRYWTTCALMSLRADTMIIARMRRHTRELPERERALVAAMELTTVTERLNAHRRLVERYPEFVDAWEALGDYLMHVAIVTRRDPRETLGAWQQVARLRPDEEDVAGALTYACLLADDPCMPAAWARYDSLMRADTSSGTRKRGHRRLLLAFAAPGRGVVDSLIDVASHDSILPMGYGVMRLPLLRAAVRRPTLIRDWDTVMAVDERKHGLTIAVEGLMDRAIRGDWMAVDSAIETQRRLGVLDGQPLRAIRLRVIAELQGFLPADARTASDALAVPPTPPRNAYAPMRVMWSDGEANTVVESNWIAGLNALLRGDVIAYRQRLGTLARDTSAAAVIAGRSVRAIYMGRSGHRAAAAESLLVLERQHGEHLAKVWGAFAADRLLAAQWLSEEQRYAPADSLLRFIDGFPLAGMYDAARAIFAPAMLQLSRIAEAMGNRGEAARFASTFLVAYDKAPPSQRMLLDEAASRIARSRRMMASTGGR